MTKSTGKRRPISAAQWLAARVVSEELPVLRVRVAAMLGCNVRTVRARAAKEGWKRPDDRYFKIRSVHSRPVTCATGGNEGETPEATDNDVRVGAMPCVQNPSYQPLPDIRQDEDPVAVLARCASFVARRVETVIALADSGEPIAKTEIDTLAAMMRMMERWEALAAERAKQEKATNDEDLAALLGRINNRIVELAQDLAGQLVANRAVAC
ncbi:hypothetical protein [Mesorhizobium sp. CAU 1732]|uniref:hypothetical protein n=1 Tax=Mesorhizobium sp. CAU 1732 TaxID=3140358 RepID=UPI0032602632